MALVPTRQFYFHPPAATFFNSLQSYSKFQGTRLHFFRYRSSIHFEKHVFFVPSNKLDAEPIDEQNPSRKSNFVNRYESSSQRSSNTAVPSNSWLDKWNEGHQQSRPKPPVSVVDYGVSESDNDLEYRENNGGSGIVRSGRSDGVGGKTMEKIVEKLKKFGHVEDNMLEKEKERVPVAEKGSVEDIFRVEEGILPNISGGFSRDSPLGIGTANGVLRFPWEKPKEEEEGEENSVKRKTRTSLAELTLPESELRRLKWLTFEKKHKTRIGGAGVTQAVVDMIHERWKTSEIVRLKFEGDAALNMRRMHEILERKTGGLVIWRSGNSVSLYRGVTYEVPSVKSNKGMYKKNENSPSSLPAFDVDPSKYVSDVISVQAPKENSGTPTNDYQENQSPPEVKYEDEVDKVLDSLGPRYADWPGCDPLPVDADMLPPVIAGYEPPFRVLPYGVRPSLGMKEATSLRRIARTLPPHFALGRNRQLQGLAAAMIKLWEKSSIAKIALKRGVQLTTSERMAEDIKKLTGGILLSRNKDFLVFYRGKDFLSPEVTEALKERERLAKSLEDNEEQARLRASALVMPSVEALQERGTAGTLEETLDADAKWGKKLNDSHKKQVIQEAELLRHAKLIHKLESKLAFAERKISKAESALAKVEECLKPAERHAEPESITDEERFMFRKLGLRMKAYLLLGRRGVFDGTIENMHLHWKYRELVKVIVNVKTFEQVKKVALALEAESGGVLVSVDKISKGYAVVVYRGKDYQRPSLLRPKNLLTKRKALARSIELQRREALLNHISGLQRRVDKLRSEIGQMENVRNEGDEALYDKLESDYPTDDDDSEEEVDGANLETYEKENDDEDEIDKSVSSTRQEIGFYSHLQEQEDEDLETDVDEIYDDLDGTKGYSEDDRDNSV